VPEEKKDDIDKQLTVGNFAKQEAVTLGLVFGGLGIGYWLGGLAVKAGFADIFRNKKATEQTEKALEFGAKKLGTSFTPETAVKLVAAFFGMNVGGTAAYYKRWVKNERERYNVQEINQDVSHIMQSRVQFEETLDKQGEFIKQLIEEKEKSLGAKDRLFAERKNSANSERKM